MRRALSGLRVFLGTVEVAGFYEELAAGLRDIGVSAAFVELFPHPFHYSREPARVPPFVKWVRQLSSLRERLARGTAVRRALASLVAGLSWLVRISLVLPWAAWRFDVFCFSSTTNIVGYRHGYWDLALLRLLGKRIICVFHGSDSRPPYMDGILVAAMRAQRGWPKNLCILTQRRRDRVLRLERLADITLDGPARGHFHRRPYVALQKVGIPRSRLVVDVKRLTPAHEAEYPRILHAPSNRRGKGSDAIAECVQKLRRQGYKFEYREISGVQNDRVLHEIAGCDFVIDQLYSDTAMPGFATEAASLGKAAVVCGYFNERRWTDEIPIYYCHPEQLEAAVVRLLTDPSFRRDLGRRAQEYVRTERSSKAVARRFLRVIEGDIPSDWWIYPAETEYIYGAAIHQTELRLVLRDLLASGGPACLQLEDKPALRQRLIEFATQ